MIAPCLTCGRLLDEVMPGFSENQPNGGVTAMSRGNYGSTVFDPMDGSTIEFILCDPCLVAAGERGSVLTARPSRQVVLEGFLIGYEELDVPKVEWRRGSNIHDDDCELHIEDFAPGAEPLPKRFHIDPQALDSALKLLAHNGE